MALATVSDISARLGRTVVGDEATQAAALIESATELVAEAVGRPSATVLARDPLDPGIKVTVVESVVRVLLNPTGATTRMEQIGVHQQRQDFRNIAMTGALGFSPAERLRVRQAWFGRVSDGAQATTLADTLGDQFATLDPSLTLGESDFDNEDNPDVATEADVTADHE